MHLHTSLFHVFSFYMLCKIQSIPAKWISDLRKGQTAPQPPLVFVQQPTLTIASKPDAPFSRVRLVTAYGLLTTQVHCPLLTALSPSLISMDSLRTQLLTVRDVLLQSHRRQAAGLRFVLSTSKPKGAHRNSQAHFRNWWPFQRGELSREGEKINSTGE